MLSRSNGGWGGESPPTYGTEFDGTELPADWYTLGVTAYR